MWLMKQQLLVCLKIDVCDFECCSEINLYNVVIILMLCKMVLLESLFIPWESTPVISVVVLQNSMDLLEGDPDSCDESFGTCTLGGNRVTSIEAERSSHITNEEDQEPVTIPAIKTEPNISCVHVVSVTNISYRVYIDVGAPIFKCFVKEILTLGNLF